jgi:transcriptional regulator with XRE-family HTH domain
MSISEQLKQAIDQSGLSLNQIAKAAGISHPMLSYFLSSDPDQRRDIRLATADKLAAFFKLGLAPLPKKTKTATARRSAGQKKKSGSRAPKANRRSRSGAAQRARRPLIQRVSSAEINDEMQRVRLMKTGLAIAPGTSPE